MGEKQPRLLCVTPNVAIDRTVVVPVLKPGSVHRATEILVGIGGKGVNVARSARTLGAVSCCAGLLAGASGRIAAEMAEAEGLDAAWSWAPAGETRTCTLVVDSSTAASTVLNEPGPAIMRTTWQGFHDDVVRMSAGFDAVAICGSLPPGVPEEAIAELAAAIQAGGVSAWVDNSGQALAHAVSAGPFGLKINHEEASLLVDETIDGPESAARAAAALRERGGSPYMAITLGAQGAVLCCAGGCWHATPADLPIRSAVGSGDAFSAGLIAGLAAGQDPEKALRQATAAGTANALHLGAGLFGKADVRTCRDGTMVAPIGV